MDAFVLVRGIGFLPGDNLRMGSRKVLVVKGNMPDDAETVCDDAKLEDIAEMAVDIKLFDLRIGGCMGRHETIGSFVRVIGFIKSLRFCIGF